jgi:fructose-1,6-bisphosphatase I
MNEHVVTLTDFIFDEERRAPHATGKFTLLLTHIENAAKIIASHIKKTGLVDLIGATGDTNSFNEEVQKLDEFTNSLLVKTLKSSCLVSLIGSEELDEPITVDHPDTEYMLFFDPLDGSSNIDTGISIGTIFSIYKHTTDHLQEGMKQVAAGYILYGTSVIFMYSSGHGVHGFTLDPSIGSFIYSHKNVKIPEKGSIYSINEGNSFLFDQRINEYLNTIKQGEKPYKLRYAGSMVADVHRTLLKGGIFIYPADKKAHHGKLRLMYEVNPLAYLVKQAGGATVSDGIDPLTITPESMHQRVPVAMGSIAEVELYNKITTG